ncbi:MAG: hypothetical protein ACK559_02005 [bacterium]
MGAVQASPSQRSSATRWKRHSGSPTRKKASGWVGSAPTGGSHSRFWPGG